MTMPPEANVPLQPPAPWQNGVSATTQLANTGEMTNYSSTGVLVPAGTTTSQTKDVITDVSFEAQLALVVDITGVTGGDTLAIQINGKTKSGTLYTILTSAALNAVGVTTLRIGTGFTTVANLSANDMLPSDMQVVCTVAGTGTIAYGIDLIIG